MKKLLLSVMITLLILACAGCGGDKSAKTGDASGAAGSASQTEAQSGAEAEETTGEDITPPPAPEEAAALFDAGEHYRIYYTPQGAKSYVLHVFDSDGALTYSLETDDELALEDVEYSGDAVVWIRLGNSSFFCNAVTGERSDELSLVYDIAAENVLLGDDSGVYVRDMFDADKNNVSIMTFGEGNDYAAEDLIDGRFTKDGASVELAFISGDEVKTEEFDVE